MHWHGLLLKLSAEAPEEHYSKMNPLSETDMPLCHTKNSCSVNVLLHCDLSATHYCNFIAFSCSF